jgi:hypothetical protein
MGSEAPKGKRRKLIGVSEIILRNGRYTIDIFND